MTQVTLIESDEATLALSSSGQDTRLSSVEQGFDSPQSHTNTHGQPKTWPDTKL